MDTLFYLWQGAGYQDHLLQSYRGFYLNIASVLLAIGAGLTVAILAFAENSAAYLVYAILVVISVFAVCFSSVMKKLIAARTADVDYYHRQILETEKDLPRQQQVLTAFKVYQKYGAGNKGTNTFAGGFDATDDSRKQLIEKGKGHTRRILDVYLPVGFLVVWVCLHMVVLLSLLL